MLNKGSDSMLYYTLLMVFKKNKKNMFLDEELLQIGRQTELTDKGIKECVGRMINVCFGSLQKNITKNSTSQAIVPNFKRVNNTWKTVAKKLE